MQRTKASLAVGQNCPRSIEPMVLRAPYDLAPYDLEPYDLVIIALADNPLDGLSLGRARLA